MRALATSALPQTSDGGIASEEAVRIEGRAALAAHRAKNVTNPTLEQQAQAA
jgi:hypothetical protein